jgi:hypothetical protein
MQPINHLPAKDVSNYSEIEAEKVERLVRKISTPVRILAVDDLRLLGMQDQLAGREAVSKCTP